MKDEYDISKAARDKFFGKDAALDLPVYLDAETRESKRHRGQRAR